MANPCGFTYTDKDGVTHNFKNETELIEGLKNGVIDASSLKEMLDAKSIQEQNDAVGKALEEVKTSANEKKADMKERVGFLINMLNEAVRLGTYNSASVRMLTKAALNIEKASNKNLAIAKFVDLLDKTSTVKDYEKKQKELNNKREALSKQLKNAKIVKEQSIFTDLTRFLSIPVEEIPASELKGYESLLGRILSKGTPVELAAQEAKMLSDIVFKNRENVIYLSEKIREFSETPEYKDLVSKGSVSDVATAMNRDGLITDAEKQFISENEDMFVSPKEIIELDKEPWDSTETLQEINDVTTSLESNRANFSQLFDKSTRQRLDQVLSGLNPKYLATLSKSKAENLLATLSMMEKGYQSRTLESFKVDIDSFNRAEKLASVFGDKFAINFTGYASRVKSVIKNIAGIKTSTLQEKLRGTFGFAKDSLFFKNLGSNERPIYENIYGRSGSIVGEAGTFTERLQGDYFDGALKEISKISGGKDNDIIKTNLRLGVFLVQRMHLAGMKNARSASDYFRSLFENPASQDTYNDAEINYLKELVDEAETAFKNNENIYLSESEKSIIEKLDESRNETNPLAQEYSFYQEGTPFVTNDAYFPIRLKKEGGDTFEDIKNRFLGKPSATATSVNEKTGVTGENFVLNLKDVVGVYELNAKELSLLPLNSESKTVSRTLSKLKKTILESDISQSEKTQKLKVLKVIEQDYQHSLESTIGVNFMPKTLADKVFDTASSMATSTKLIGVDKVFADMFSNIVNALEKPQELLSGMGTFKSVISGDLNHAAIIENIGTQQGPRISNKSKILQGTEVLGSGKRSSRPSEIKSKMIDTLRFLNKKSVGTVYDYLEEFNKIMINNPDVAVAIPLFYGSFESKFEELTGEKPSYEQIQDGDVEYMDKYRDAIYQSQLYADTNLSKTIGTKNPFNLPEKLRQGKGDSAGYRLWRMTNQFFNSFNLAQASAVQDSFRRGNVEGAKTAAVKLGANIAYGEVTRAIKMMVLAPIGAAIATSLVDDEEDKVDLPKGTTRIDETEEDKIFDERRRLIDAIIQTATQGRGAVGKQVVSSLVEEANKQFGEDITYSGKYSPNFGGSNKKKIGFSDAISEAGNLDNLSPKVPIIDIASKGIQKVITAVSPEKKDEDTGSLSIEKSQTLSRSGKILDAMSSLGLIPVSRNISFSINDFKNNVIYNKQYLKEKGANLSERQNRIFAEKEDRAMNNIVFDMFWLDFKGNEYYSNEEVKKKQVEAKSKIEAIFDKDNEVVQRALYTKYNHNFAIAALDSNIPEDMKKYWYEEVNNATASDAKMSKDDLVMLRRQIERYKKNPPKVVDRSKEVDELINGYKKGDETIESLTKRLNEDIIYSNDKESLYKFVQFIEEQARK
jgi:hypothetical protein